MSGFDLIPSGIPPGPDVTDSPDLRGGMTHLGHLEATELFGCGMFGITGIENVA